MLIAIHPGEACFHQALQAAELFQEDHKYICILTMTASRVPVTLRVFADFRRLRSHFTMLISLPGNALVSSFPGIIASDSGLV